MQLLKAILTPMFAAQCVNQVVATDRKRITIASCQPHRQIGPRQPNARGNCRRASVDGVKP